VIEAATRLDRAAWAGPRGVPDPEVPVLSVVELGIVRDVQEAEHGALEVVLTPTYSGCPATEAIEPERARRARRPRPGARADAAAPRPGPPTGSAPTAAQAARLRHRAAGAGGHCRPAACQPSCGCRRSPARAAAAPHTERLSAFGSTACKALYRCLPAASPSNTSSRSDRTMPTEPTGRTPLLPSPAVRRIEPDTDEAVIVSFDVPRRCARSSPSPRAST
jgi:ring-1,2-phenylacetyl-CoA epoxidase subunit PaaD